MKLKIYSIRDKKTGFGDPIILNNDEVAIRAFQKWVNSENENQANQFIEDKEFYCLGSYDTEKGTIEPENRFLSTAIEQKTINPVQVYKRRTEELEERLMEEKQKYKKERITIQNTIETLQEKIKMLEQELKEKQTNKEN